MASAHGHLNNEVMNNNRPPAPKFRKWLMRNNKSSLSGLIGEVGERRQEDPTVKLLKTVLERVERIEARGPESMRKCPCPTDQQ